MENQEKSIVSVVFDFDPESFSPRPLAKQYTYFAFGPVKVGDLAVVLSPMSGTIVGVLVVTTEPGAAAIGRATKALLGLVDVSAAKAADLLNREQATKKAWERFAAGG